MNAPSQNILAPNFQKRQPYKLQREGVYLDPRSTKEKPRFYIRVRVHGRPTWRVLDATTLKAAVDERRTKLTDQARAKIGLAVDPFLPSAQVATIRDLADLYIRDGCPKRRGGARTEQTDREERKRVETLVQFWGRKTPAEITPENQYRFRDWRVARLVRTTSGAPRGRGGLRQVHKELVTLSNIFTWAILHHSQTGITTNPLRDRRVSLCDPKAVVHCRDHMPENAEQLHAIARYLFQSDRSAVLGWLALFQAMIGQRISEIVRLRMDAKPEAPGYIQRTREGNIGRCLFLYRSTSSKGTYHYAEIHSALRDCLEHFLAWHKNNCADSPWYFPSPEDPHRPVTDAALTHALKRICPALGIGHRTSHGLRSYYVNVLRSQGKTDGEIALRIGQRSGGKLIVEVYGEIRPYKISWLPENETPAWEIQAAPKWTEAKDADFIKRHVGEYRPPMGDTLL